MAFHSFVFDVLRVFIVAVSKSIVHGCTLYLRHESSVVRTRTSLFGPSGLVHAPFLDVAWQLAPVPDRLLTVVVVNAHSSDDVRKVWVNEPSLISIFSTFTWLTC